MRKDQLSLIEQMDSEQIESVMTQCSFAKRHFGGVFASDEIPFIEVNYEDLPQAFVFNYDPSYMSGSHWVACILQEKEGNKYFDSYGEKPMLEEMKDFLKDDYHYNKFQLQDEFSSTCGQWCVFFLWYNFTHQHFPWSFKFDPKKTLENDYMVNKWVDKTFDLHLKVIDKSFLTKQMSKQMAANLKSEDFPLKKRS